MVTCLGVNIGKWSLRVAQVLAMAESVVVLRAGLNDCNTIRSSPRCTV
jgi:hypothetical protein